MIHQNPTPDLALYRVLCMDRSSLNRQSKADRLLRLTDCLLYHAYDIVDAHKGVAWIDEDGDRQQATVTFAKIKTTRHFKLVRKNVPPKRKTRRRRRRPVYKKPRPPLVKVRRSYFIKRWCAHLSRNPTPSVWIVLFPEGALIIPSSVTRPTTRTIVIKARWWRYWERYDILRTMPNVPHDVCR